MNQCDGCQRGNKPENGIHHLGKPGGMVLCTADRYRETPSQETPSSILAWAEATFGRAPSNYKIAKRALDEMIELCDALEVDDEHPNTASEIADVFIVLSQLAARRRIDIQAEINRKMATNRGRVWITDGAGCGQHVTEIE